MEKTEKQKLFNIFFATAVGICIGFILIKECLASMSPWFSLVGGLISAFSAYILNDWRGALRGISEAWRMTKHQAPKILIAIGNTLWKIIKFSLIESHESRTSVFYFTASLSIIIASFFLYVFLFALAFIQLKLTAFASIIICIWMAFTWLCFTTAGLASFENRDDPVDVPFLKKIIFWTLPFIHLPYLLYLVLKNLPSIVKYAALFGLKFILLIHTTDRLISAIDAFIFTMLAYGIGELTHSWVAGSVGIHLAVFAILGGIFGVFNKLYVKPLFEKWAVRLTPIVKTEE